jgi:hypothetical protein
MNLKSNKGVLRLYKYIFISNFALFSTIFTIGAGVECARVPCPAYVSSP